MNKFFGIAAVVCLCFLISGCRNKDSGPITVIPEYDPMFVLPDVVDDETDADIIEVPTPEPLTVSGETVYPIYYGGEVAVTKDKAEWESWLRDPSRAPLSALHVDRDFVLTWCRQFAQAEPEDVGLILMNYFEYAFAPDGDADPVYTAASNPFPYPANPWYYPYNPQIRFFNWEGLRKCIENRKLVCAGYAQLFYLIVKEKYPDVKYIRNPKIAHARNYFEGDYWDLTWLDDPGVDYNPDKIKFDFIGMQDRIDETEKILYLKEGLYRDSSDWLEVNIFEGNGGHWGR
ncbi:MAG: hypothetical protein LBO65_03475 [Spirochaetaceae bacterium]|jgi:hypothetical protein|nr:hypothetical protein [Spirochaetaceae bacterium]